GYQTARILEERGLRSRLIEQDGERARWLAEQLPDTVVMEHDATDTEFLSREHVDEADIVVTALDSDERNLLAAVLAKRLGVDRVVSVVDSADYVTVFEEIGIDVAINPRTVTAEEIIRFTFESVAENIAVLENDRAEVLELELDEGCALVGRPIRELVEEIDAKFVIGAIVRDGEHVTPRGDTVLRPGDHVIVLVETAFTSELASMA
ncbi:Trk system potassium transporter TrkA, partial [Halorubrum sp. SD626R]|uniref:NAD-binding protein n=2 Tax=Halorubrum TaxID=56688 RepID=UPI0011385CBF